MKTKPILFLLSLNLFGVHSFAHDQIVHEAITVNAAESALHNSPGYSSFLSIVSSDLPLFGVTSATNYLRIGSYDEDYDPDNPDNEKTGGYRSLNHFYDPLDNTYGKGLSDSVGFSGPGPIGDKRRLVGTNSFSWGSISNCIGIDFSGVTVFGLAQNVDTFNIFSWPNARYYELRGLTAATPLDRQTNLLAMFRAVGQVMHLLEDTSQPQHVRNEQHVDPFVANSWKEQHDPWASPIEIYGYNHVTNLNFGDGSMLNWSDAGFSKLEDFWDRHLYDGSSSAALIAAETGGAQLGLAEWCNGNFLGDRHKYAEYYSPGDIRYYPFPSRAHSTDFINVKATPSIGVDTYTLKNGQTRQGIYLTKNADGVWINHHTRFTTLGAHFPNALLARSTTIRDDNVLKDYHDAFIPKAVQYSAGLLDYFCRGQLGMSIQGSYDTNTVIFTMTNLSSQSF